MHAFQYLSSLSTCQCSPLRHLTPSLCCRTGSLWSRPGEPHVQPCQSHLAARFRARPPHNPTASVRALSFSSYLPSRFPISIHITILLKRSSCFLVSRTSRPPLTSPRFPSPRRAPHSSHSDLSSFFFKCLCSLGFPAYTGLPSVCISQRNLSTPAIKTPVVRVLRKTLMRDLSFHFRQGRLGFICSHLSLICRCLTNPHANAMYDGRGARTFLRPLAAAHVWNMFHHMLTAGPGPRGIYC